MFVERLGRVSRGLARRAVGPTPSREAPYKALIGARYGSAGRGSTAGTFRPHDTGPRLGLPLSEAHRCGSTIADIGRSSPPCRPSVLFDSCVDRFAGRLHEASGDALRRLRHNPNKKARSGDEALSGQICLDYAPGNFRRLSRRALTATKKLEPDIERAATSGRSTSPNAGWNTPAAMGRAIAL